MREGDETTTTFVPSIMGSKDLDASSSRVSTEQSKEAKDLNIDELADLIVARLNPQAKNAAHRDNQENVHLYPRRDMVWCSVCSRNHPSNECLRLRARPPTLRCGYCNRWGNHETSQCRYPRMLPPAQTQSYQPRPQQLALRAPPVQMNQFIQGANNVRPMPYQPQYVPLRVPTESASGTTSPMLWVCGSSLLQRMSI